MKKIIISGYIHGEVEDVDYEVFKKFLVNFYKTDKKDNLPKKSPLLKGNNMYYFNNIICKVRIYKNDGKFTFYFINNSITEIIEYELGFELKTNYIDSDLCINHYLLCYDKYLYIDDDTIEFMVLTHDQNEEDKEFKYAIETINNNMGLIYNKDSYYKPFLDSIVNGYNVINKCISDVYIYSYKQIDTCAFITFKHRYSSCNVTLLQITKMYIE